MCLKKNMHYVISSIFELTYIVTHCKAIKNVKNYHQMANGMGSGIVLALYKTMIILIIKVIHQKSPRVVKTGKRNIISHQTTHEMTSVSTYLVLCIYSRNIYWMTAMGPALCGSFPLPLHNKYFLTNTFPLCDQFNEACLREAPENPKILHEELASCEESWRTGSNWSRIFPLKTTPPFSTTPIHTALFHQSRMTQVRQEGASEISTI